MIENKIHYDILNRPTKHLQLETFLSESSNVFLWLRSIVSISH